MHRYDEVLSFAPAQITACQRVFGTEHENTLFLQSISAEALYAYPGASLADRAKAEANLVDVSRIARRVLGASHPRTRDYEDTLNFMRLGEPVDI